MMRSVFLDVELEFETPAEAEESEEILLRVLGVVARLNLYHRRRNPSLPSIYSREAGIVYSPPDQMRGWRIDQSKIPKVVACLQSVGADDEAVANVLRVLSGIEIFQDINRLYKRRHGDCDRLVCARLAELWYAGLWASPYLIGFPNKSGGTTYHAVVKHLDGSSEDPSLILGMGGSARAAERAEEIRKNVERHENLVRLAADIMVHDGRSPEALGAVIDAAAYVPRGGFPSC